jgi:hypothetical protein
MFQYVYSIGIILCTRPAWDVQIVGHTRTRFSKLLYPLIAKIAKLPARYFCILYDIYQATVGLEVKIAWLLSENDMVHSQISGKKATHFRPLS